jgi:hypothetical protein
MQKLSTASLLYDRVQDCLHVKSNRAAVQRGRADSAIGGEAIRHFFERRRKSFPEPALFCSLVTIRAQPGAVGLEVAPLMLFETSFKLFFNGQRRSEEAAKACLPREQPVNGTTYETGRHG